MEEPMKNSVEKAEALAEYHLQEGEEVVIKAKLSPHANTPALIYFICMSVFGILIGGLMIKLSVAGGILLMLFGILNGGIMYWFFKAENARVSLVITNKRVMGKSGMFFIKMLDQPIDKIDSVTIQYTSFGRRHNYGTVVISGAGNPNNTFSAIGNAEEVKNVLSKAIEQSKMEARIAQAEQIAIAMNLKNNQQ